MAVNKPDPVRNLGHKASNATLTKNPAGYPHDYENGPADKVINEKRSVGVYGKFRDPQSGISSAENLSRWSGYASEGSYQGKDGKAPVTPDPRTGRRTSNQSDNYLASMPETSTKTWADHRDGSESGPGRLEKIHRK